MALVEAPNARALVHATPAEDLYFLVTEVGIEDSLELVQLASPAQFRTFVDLAGWKRDQLDSHALLTWLRAARGDDPEDFLRKVAKLDLELLEILLRELTVIYDLEEDPDANPDGVTLEMPEGKYLIEFKVEGVEQFTLRTLINDLIAQNPFEAGRLVEAIRWELPSELQEAAYQFRAARLSELGFPELEVAMRLFSYVSPASVTKPQEHPLSTSGALAPGTSGVDYLKAALDGLKPDEQNALESELRYLINAALVAEAAEPGDMDAVRGVSERSRDYLLLGLEYLTSADPLLASQVVRDLTTQRIFQVGFSLTLELKFRADRLLRRPLSHLGGQPWVLEPERTALAALRRKRPLKALKVEGAEPVPFRTLRELAAARAILDCVEAQLALFAVLLGPTAEEGALVLRRFEGLSSPLTPELLLRAAVAHAVLDGNVWVAPLPPQRLVALGEALFEGTAPAPLIRHAARAQLHRTLLAPIRPELAQAVQRVLDASLEVLKVELGTVFLSHHGFGPEVAEILPVMTTP